MTTDNKYLDIEYLNKISNNICLEDLECFLELDYLNSLNNDEFNDYLDYKEYEINHKKEKNLVFCFFIRDNEYNFKKSKLLYEKYIIRFKNLLDNVIRRDDFFNDYGIILFIQESLIEEYYFGNDINYYTIKKNTDFLGSLWRFMSVDLDYSKNNLICDIDIYNLDYHKVFERYNYSCRTIGNIGNDKGLADLPKYSLIEAGLIKFLKSDFDFNMKDIIKKFLYHQKYNLKNEKKTLYTNVNGYHGFGNYYNEYGIDERFLSKVIYPYLIKKGCLLTTIQKGYKNIFNKLDIEYFEKYNNKKYFC